MAMPSFLRDLSPRIKSLGSPVVWAPLTIIALLGAFAWEYSTNPDWFNQEQTTNLNPNSSLTDEEQARLSEIDTIELLLEQSQASGGAQSAISIISPDQPDQPATTTEINPSTNSRQLSGRDNPFAPYAADYEFPGAKASASGSGSIYGSNGVYGSNASGGNGSGNVSFGNSPMMPVAPVTNSALSQALDRQQLAKNAADSQPNTPQPTVSQEGLGTSLQAPIAEGPSSSQLELPSNNQSVSLPVDQPVGQPIGQPIGQSGLQPAPASGNIPVPYIRTTPAMSPPIGTTGYRAPATIDLPVFNVAPQQPSRNPFSARPSTPSAPATPQAETLYTAPTSVQPEQTPQRR